MPLTIATWNVNSVRARLPRVVPWLRANKPDVICLQETKVEDSEFPIADLKALDYHVTLFGQRTYNGVAILSRLPAEEIVRGFGDGVEDSQARFLAARIGGLRVASLYVPNGQAVGTAKFVYKLDWLRRWRGWLDAHADHSAPFVLCGDFNVAPEDRDVHDPAAWSNQVLCHPDERAALSTAWGWGLEDVFRRHTTDAGHFTWWDYRQLSFPRNHGLRIDHILCTPSLAARCRTVVIDRAARKGKDASDHVPVVATFDPSPLT